MNFNKLLHVLLCTIIMPFLGFAQEQPYSITGKIGRLNPPAKAYLFFDETIDSVVIRNGSFEFTGKVDKAMPAYIVVNPKGTGALSAQLGYIPFKLNLYLEPGKIAITSADTISRAVVSGGSLNADFATLNAQLKRAEEVLDSSLSASADSRQSQTFKERYDWERNAVSASQKAVYLKFIHDHPHSLMSLFILRVYAGFSSRMLPSLVSENPGPAEIDSLYHSLSGDILTGKPGVEAGAAFARKRNVGIGAIAPDFSQADTAGKLISLREFRGKYLLIDFWASWCSPCRQENPNLVKAYDKYASKGFGILGVSLNYSHEKEQWLNAIRKDHLTWPQVSDLKGWKNEVAKLYAVRQAPQNFLLDPDGKIIATDLLGDALENKLSEVFAN